jgi:arylsulfatase A-like enzyme
MARACSGAIALAAALILVSCGDTADAPRIGLSGPPGAAARRPATGPGFSPRPTRGYILISLDTLRADHLGAYGYHRDTSPFLDRLAERSVLFERAVVQFPGTLISHMSMFTGYYPMQHAVYKPGAVLSPEIETLPERLRAAGFRTSGHTEGGFMAAGFGFERGFEEFVVEQYQSDEDIERTFERGLSFIERLGADERFFVFLHTYSIHDPYEPPEAYRHAFWEGAPATALAPDGPTLQAVNDGFRGIDPIDEESVEYFEALYDGSILYVDSVLERFFGRLAALGVADDTTVVITSDNGEEFFDHGKMAHEQIYPESLFVPLLFVHPDLAHGIRVPALVQSIDYAPTLLDLAGLDVPERLPGNSLVPYFREPGAVLATEAYAEVAHPVMMRSVIVDHEGEILQLVVSEPPSDPDGTWMPLRLAFDTDEERLDLELLAFADPRPVSVAVNGEPVAELEVWPRGLPFRLDLPRRHGGDRITLTTPACESPLRLGRGDDPRCLSIKVRGATLRRRELFDLGSDPAAARDLHRVELDLRRALEERLRYYRFEPVAGSSERQLDEATRKTLEALGYL